MIALKSLESSFLRQIFYFYVKYFGTFRLVSLAQGLDILKDGEISPFLKGY